MIRLDATTKSLELVLGGAVTTNQLPIVVSWSDKTTTTYTGGNTTSQSNNTTGVTICAAPAASTIRDIDSVSVYNADTAAATVTVRENDNSTLRILIKITLGVGEQLFYSHGSSWCVIGSDGAIKHNYGGVLPVTDDTTTNATMYPIWVSGSAGSYLPKVSSSKMSFNPSTGVLSVTASSVSNGFYTNTNQTLTAAKRCGQTSLTSSTSITPNFNDNNDFTLTLAHNTTLNNPSNLTAGQSGAIIITQDGTGGRTMAYGSYWKFESGTAPTLTTTASAIDVLAYYVESSTRITAKLIKDIK